MEANAAKIMRAVGRAGRFSGYRPRMVRSGAMAWRTARSTRLKTSRARQMTVMRAAMRRLFFKTWAPRPGVP